MLEPNAMNTLARTAVNRAPEGRPPMFFCPQCGGLHHAHTGMTDRTGRTLRLCRACSMYFPVVSGNG